MKFVINLSMTEEELVDVQSIVMNSVALNMITMSHQNKYGAIKNDDPVAEGFYVVHFT